MPALNADDLVATRIVDSELDAPAISRSHVSRSGQDRSILINVAEQVVLRGDAIGEDRPVVRLRPRVLEGHRNFAAGRDRPSVGLESRLVHSGRDLLCSIGGSFR